MNTPITYQQRVFPSDGKNNFCLHKPKDQQIGEALAIAERAVNEAIQEGVSEVSIRYLNTLDAVENPFGDIGMVHVMGYRELKKETELDPQVPENNPTP